MSDRQEDDLINPSIQDGNQNTVLIGDRQNKVSAQLIQEIFTELTGTPESITESFSNPYQIEFSNIQDLHHRITQTLEQYNVISQNFAVIIYYVDNTKDELNSFDRFAFQNSASSSAVESVFVKYSLLIVPSKSQRTQTYTVSIRITSAVALRKRFESEDFLGAPPSIIRMMGGRTAYSKVDYVDYSVARSVQAVIKEWFSVLPQSDRNSLISLLQRRSHNIPRLLRFFAVLASSAICYQEASRLMPAHNFDLTYLTQMLISSFALIYSSYVISSWFGDYAEASLDNWFPMSYLKFNRGDEAEIRRYEKKNRRSITLTLVGVVCSLSSSIVTKILSSIIVVYVLGHHGS